jgi:GLPGLI family protein
MEFNRIYLLFLLLSLNLFSQHSKIYYELKYKEDSLQKEPSVEEKMILRLEDNETFFYPDFFVSLPKNWTIYNPNINEKKTINFRI